MRYPDSRTTNISTSWGTEWLSVYHGDGEPDSTFTTSAGLNPEHQLRTALSKRPKFGKGIWQRVKSVITMMGFGIAATTANYITSLPPELKSDAWDKWLIACCIGLLLGIVTSGKKP